MLVIFGENYITSTIYYIPAILNLGYSYPLGVRKQFTGGTQNFKLLQNKLIKGKQMWFRGIREGGQFRLRGTQRGSILIWGFASNKRLGTAI